MKDATFVGNWVKGAWDLSALSYGMSIYNYLKLKWLFKKGYWNNLSKKLWQCQVQLWQWNETVQQNKNQLSRTNSNCLQLCPTVASSWKYILTHIWWGQGSIKSMTYEEKPAFPNEAGTNMPCMNYFYNLTGNFLKDHILLYRVSQL